MDYAQELQSTMERQARAAMFLAGQGSAAEEFVPLLLDAMQRVDQQVPVLGRLETTLVSHGVISLGHILAKTGLDLQKPVHRRAYEWMLQQADSPHDLGAGGAVWALGWLQHPEAIPVLRAIAESDARADNPDHAITVPGSAFRALMRIDREVARELIGSQACQEYLAGVQNWLKAGCSEAMVEELKLESAWLESER